MTDLSRWNNSDIWLSYSQTVSPENRASKRVRPSCVW
jgi:hypothetical protein